MKKLLIVLVLIVGFIIGCATTTSVSETAKPDKIVQNGDGTTTFQFLFQENGYDPNMATDRIADFVNSYAIEKGLGSPNLIYGKAVEIPKKNWGRAIVQGLGNGLSSAGANLGHTTYTPTNHDVNDYYIQVTVKISFEGAKK